jgi:putative membrane protein
MSSERRRTHPSDVVFQTLESLRELLLPLAVGAVIGASGDDPVVVLLVGAVGIAVGAFTGVLRWRTTTYLLTDQAISLRTGILSPDDTVVPIARISAVDIEQGPLQRVLGVVELQVQVAGSAEPEIRLRPLARADAKALAAALAHPAGARREPDWRLSGRRLLLVGLSAPQIGVLAPLLAGAGALVQQLAQAGDAGRVIDALPDTPAAGLAAVALLLVAAGLVSVIGGVVAFAGFEVVVDGDRLRLRRGLLRRRVSTVPLDRVHAVRLVESPLYQPLGLLRVRMETGGYGAKGRASGMLLPVVHRREASPALGRLVPALAESGGDLSRPPARALRRYLTVPAAAGAAAAAAVAIALPAAWPAGAALLVAALGAGALRYADAGWALRHGRIVVRRRRLGRTTLVARAARLQRHEVSRSPLQRRAGLAGFGLAVGSGATAAVAHLDDEVAEGLLTALRP